MRVGETPVPIPNTKVKTYAADGTALETETPVPIPNTMVKTYAADGTALETVWESRWLPAPNQKHGEVLIENRTGTHRSVPT